MRFLRSSNRQPIEIAPDREINSGGEARIYSIESDDGLIAKIYRRPKPDTGRKLRRMVQDPPPDPTLAHGHTSIAWPVDLLLSEADGSVTGYLMPYIAGAHSVLDLYNPGIRRETCPLFNYQYLYRAAQNLAAVVHALHTRDYVIGDVNESNVLVMDTALVTIVDTDSFQVPGLDGATVFHCPVGKPEFTPPEMQGEILPDIRRTPVHDRFGLAVLIFQLLMEGTHPFAGIYTGEDDPPPYEDRIAAGHYPYGTRETPYCPMPQAPPIDLLPSVIRTMFQRCFEDGHRNPQSRPHASAWMQALKEAEADLEVCGINDQHYYGSHFNMCPWCKRTDIYGGIDPFPSKLRVVSGRHLDPLPITTQSALPSSAAPSIGAAIAEMPPPDSNASHSAAPMPRSPAAVIQSLKPTMERLTSLFRNKIDGIRTASTASDPTHRITYSGRAATAAAGSSASVLRARRRFLLVVLALAIAAITIGVTQRGKLKNMFGITKSGKP